MANQASPDVYGKLARYLDDLPAGFPATGDGAELQLLRTLFTPEEARLALHLTLLGEEARVIARRARLPLREVTERLENMFRKGLIDASYPEGKPPRYMVSQFVIGFWEGQVNRLTRETAEAFEAYIPHAGPQIWRNGQQLRTIPIGESIESTAEIMAYEQAERIVAHHRTIGVMNCVCRQEQQLLGHDCGKPLETCMVFGDFVNSAERIGRARRIDRDEALALLRQAEAAGLVLQPANSQRPAAICMCCGCCCGVLRILKMHDRPAEVAVSPFRAVLNAEECMGCGACEERCQMDALALGGDGYAVLKEERCIGCGLCVTTCPGGALSMVRKPAAEQPAIPAVTLTAYLGWGWARGKMLPTRIAKIAVRSGIDRVLAPRAKSTE
jgi:Na+-translocating ferredoxin:NAD+ oxidoreductase subunit B